MEVAIAKTSQKTSSASSRPISKVKSLQEWFTKTEPTANFDENELRWEALKEKYNL